MIGASGNKEKYGYEVFKTLLDYGYKVYPINPKYEFIDGYKCFRSIDEIPERPEVVVTVVPPSVTEEVIDTCIKLGISTIWMPPGSWSELAIEKCEENRINVIHDICLVFALKSFNFNKEGGTK